MGVLTCYGSHLVLYLTLEINYYYGVITKELKLFPCSGYVLRLSSSLVPVPFPLRTFERHERQDKKKFTF